MIHHSFQPFFADGALQFAFEKATVEGKVTISVLFLLSLFSWSIIISKTRQLMRARRRAESFFEAYNATRDPLELKSRASGIFRRACLSSLHKGRGGIGISIDPETLSLSKGSGASIRRPLRQ